MISTCQIVIYCILTIHCVTSDLKPSDGRVLRVLTNRYSKTTVTTTTTVKLSTATSRGNLSPREPKVTDDSSIIHFPSSSSAQNPGKTGDKCVTFYGKIGTCEPTYNCFQERPPFQTQMLAHCGFVNGKALICCPEEAVVNSGPKRPDKPKVSKDAVISIQFPETIEPNEEHVATGNVALVQPPKVSQDPASSQPTAVVSPLPMPIPMQTVKEGTVAIDSGQHVKPDQSNATKNSEGTSSVSKPIQPDVSHTASHNGIIDNFSELQQTCGIYNIAERGGGRWPWIVSIGHRDEDGSIQWRCLGSLVTREYILTSALCLQHEANVIALGEPILGKSTKVESKALDLVSISQVQLHQKFISPYLYKNVGLIQISPVTVTADRIPICFPFLASVLDIIHFQGYKAKTIGFHFPVNTTAGIKFGTEEYKIIGNEPCSRVFENRKNEIVDSFPRGLGADHVCVLKKNPTSICPAPGAPLVLFDEASSSNVIIGIASGDPTCNKFNRQLLTFTRMNAYSTWVRERIATFPTPPPCYY